MSNYVSYEELVLRRVESLPLGPWGSHSVRSCAVDLALRPTARVAAWTATTTAASMPWVA